MPSQQQLTSLHSAVPAAQACARKWGVPASVTLAQWIPESSWGTSKLALAVNNYFGVKCVHLQDPSQYVEMPTPEYIANKRVIMLQKFQRYPNVEASFEDHGRLLATAKRYGAAMAAKADPKAFVVGLAHGGYSTNPDYAKELLGYMRLYNLSQYDVSPASTPAAKSEAV